MRTHPNATSEGAVSDAAVLQTRNRSYTEDGPQQERVDDDWFEEES